MYTDRNFKTKKALKTAVAEGRKIEVFQPNNIFNAPPPRSCVVTVEGPHYPEPHKWYAKVTLDAEGFIVKVS